MIKRILISASFVLYALCGISQILGIVGSQQVIPSSLPSLPAPDFWLNGNDQTKYTTTVDFEQRIIDQATSSDSHAYTSTSLNSGTLVTKPSFNGEAYYFNSLVGFTFGTTSTFNALHNGTAFTMFFVFKYLANPSAGTQYNIIRTIGANVVNNSQIGIAFNVRNTTGAVNTLRFAISNAAGGTSPFDITGTTNALTNDTWYVAKITFTGSALTLQVRAKGTATYTTIGTDNTGSSLSGSNAQGSMLFGGAANGAKSYYKQLFWYNRILTSGESTDVEAWIDNELNNLVTVTNAYVVCAFGQSNMYGQALLSQVAADLASGTDLGGKVYYSSSNSFTDGVGYWDKYISGSTTKPGAPSEIGAMLRFVKNMAAVDGVPVYLIIRGVGGTRMIPPSSWSSVSPVSGSDLYPLYTNQATTFALEELVHIQRKQPILRALIKMQGETDATENVASVQSLYTSEWENWIINYTTFLNNLGYSTSKLRVINPRVRNNSGGAGWALVQAAETDVMDNFLINHPSESTKVKATKWVDTDNLDWVPPHYTAVSMDSIGCRIWRSLRYYKNE